MGAGSVTRSLLLRRERTLTARDAPAGWANRAAVAAEGTRAMIVWGRKKVRSQELTPFYRCTVWRLVKASDTASGAGTIDFAYDILDRLTQETTPTRHRGLSV